MPSRSRNRNKNWAFYNDEIAKDMDGVPLKIGDAVSGKRSGKPYILKPSDMTPEGYSFVKVLDSGAHTIADRKTMKNCRLLNVSLDEKKTRCAQAQSKYIWDPEHVFGTRIR
jgi:hypothetical protein